MDKEEEKKRYYFLRKYLLNRIGRIKEETKTLNPKSEAHNMLILELYECYRKLDELEQSAILLFNKGCENDNHPLWIELDESNDEYHNLTTYLSCQCVKCGLKFTERARYFDGKVVDSFKFNSDYWRYAQKYKKYVLEKGELYNEGVVTRTLLRKYKVLIKK